MVATLQEDYILMAKSKGISDGRVLWRHALRPSSLTLLTVAGLNVGTLIGGALIVEVIFHLNGLGFAISDAINRRQYIALQDYIAVVAIVYVLVNFAWTASTACSTRGSAVLESADTDVGTVIADAALPHGSALATGGGLPRSARSVWLAWLGDRLARVHRAHRDPRAGAPAPRPDQRRLPPSEGGPVLARSPPRHRRLRPRRVQPR